MLPQFQSRPLVRVLCLPDIDRPIGGVKQLYRHVEHLVALGWDAAMLSEESGFRPTWFTSSAPCISLAESHALGELDPNHCLLLIPETYLNADLSNLRGLNLSGLLRVVFNQNAYYSYGQINSGTAQAIQSFYGDPAVLQVLSVSEDTHRFLACNLGISDARLSRIVNAIEPSFRPAAQKFDRMHWMPRKNADHVQAILLGLQSGVFSYLSGWQGEPLANIDHAQVAERLNGARLFLAFGHPEGFGLPIAEAMAAGCWVVGYSGGGGSELFRFGAAEEVSFGDWAGYLAAIQRALVSFAEKPRETECRLQRQALAIRTLYSIDQERHSILVAWRRIEEQFQFRKTKL